MSRALLLTSAAAAAIALTVAPLARADAQSREEAQSREGEIPSGFRRVRRHTWGIVGVSVLGGGYALSAISGFGLLSACHVPGLDEPGSDCEKSIGDTSAAWLFVPVVGPFAALTRSDVEADGGAVFWFITFGAAQLAGAGLLVYDWLVPHYSWVAEESARLEIVPVWETRMKGLQMRGHF